MIHLLPVWMFHHFPTQDGSSHVYNAHVLKEYHRHENYTIRDVYRLNLTLFPNWASHALLAGLLYLLPPIVCEKIVVSLCVAGLPLSLLYFLRAIDRRNALLALVGFPF
ncbi:MAG TPA: GtrA family protein, partial [Planctomycetes bacterium]|nr:GtrA family protein [Planctomycetota bacterium]